MCSGQDKLVPNTNPNTVKHTMVLENDSIKITSDFPVTKFHMWNEGEFEIKKYNPIYEGKSMSIDISQVPKGYYIIATSIGKEMVITNLFKNDETGLFERPIGISDTTPPINKPNKKPTPKEVALKKRIRNFVFVKVPYDVSTRHIRAVNRDSDTIIIKETRDEYKERMGYSQLDSIIKNKQWKQ